MVCRPTVRVDEMFGIIIICLREQVATDNTKRFKVAFLTESNYVFS